MVYDSAILSKKKEIMKPHQKEAINCTECTCTNNFSSDWVDFS